MTSALFHVGSRHIDYSVSVYMGTDFFESEPCPRCGLRRYGDIRPSLVATVNGAEKMWPDVVSFGRSLGIAVSDRVMADLLDGGIKGMRFDELRLQGVPAKKPCPWKYWLVAATGDASFLPEPPEGVPQPACPKCGMWDLRHLAGTWPGCSSWPLRVSSWSGDDFVRGFHGTTWSIMCTGRVVELARNRGWTNAEFSPAGTSVAVEHLRPDWHERIAVDLKRYYGGMSLREISEARARERETTVETATEPEESPASDHPFDDITYDGYACQGWCDLDAAFGGCCLVVYPDGDDGPSDEQRELFDEFVASSSRWLPHLQRKLPVALRKAVADGRIKLAEPVPPKVAEFSNLARWLQCSEVSVKAQEGKTEGLIEVSYSIRGTDWTVRARIRPGADTPGQLVRVSVHPIDECEADGELVQTGPDRYELVVTPKQERDEGEEDSAPGG